MAGSKIADQIQSDDEELFRSEKPHIAIVTLKFDIRALNPDNTMDMYIMGDEALRKYEMARKAQFCVKGHSEADCIKKLKQTLERINNG
jgi:hypothetical protein